MLVRYDSSMHLERARPSDRPIDVCTVRLRPLYEVKLAVKSSRVPHEQLNGVDMLLMQPIHWTPTATAADE